MSDMRFPRPTAREEFRKKLRADLMNEAVALAESRRTRPTSGLRDLFASGAWRPALVVAGLVLFLVGGTGVAAAGSLPGDATYGLKRAAEQIELAFAFTDDQRAEVLARQAQRRLDELSQAAEDRPDKAPTASEAYETAVERFRAAVEAVRSAEPADKREAVEELVDAARDKHVKVLEALRERVPAPAQEGIDKAIEQHRRLESGQTGQRGKSGDRGPKGTDVTPSPTPTGTATAAPRVDGSPPRGDRPSSLPGRP